MKIFVAKRKYTAADSTFGISFRKFQNIYSNI